MYDGQGVQIKLCKLGIGWLRSQMYGVFEGSLKVPRSQAHLGILYTFPVDITMYYLCRVVCTNKMFIVWHCNKNKTFPLGFEIHWRHAMHFYFKALLVFLISKELKSLANRQLSWILKKINSKTPNTKMKKSTCFRCIFSAMCTSRYCTLKLIK